MAFKMKYKNLKAVVEELRGAVKAHGKQADTIEEHIDSMEGDSSMKKYVSDDQRKAVHASKAERSGLKKKVSWKYGDGTYSGELIPSMETKTHRFARTHNDKIKKLPK